VIEIEELRRDVVGYVSRPTISVLNATIFIGRLNSSSMILSAEHQSSVSMTTAKTLQSRN